MNDLPIDQIPPNVQHLQRSELGKPIAPDNTELKTSDFEFTVSPFDEIMTQTVLASCNSPTFGFQIETDEINGRTYINDILRNTSAHNCFGTLSKNKRRRIKGSYITAINGTPVFDKDSVIREFNKLRDKIRNGTIDKFTIDIAPLSKLARKTLWKECDEHDIFIPDPHTDNSVASINVHNLRVIAMIRTSLDINESDISTEEVLLMINALRSNDTTPEEQALGHFTRRKLKTLDNWPQWRAGEHKQLDQFHNLGIYGEPCKLPPDGILLRSHWQYQVRQNGDW